MIYTITTNPSLDYYIDFDSDVIASVHNRAKGESYGCGGKGVNVSIFLNSLGINTSAIGFLGGFTKDYYLKLISKYRYIQPLFTSISDNTRINVKAIANHETSLNARGPHISEDEFKKFDERLRKIFKGDIVVLSGNVQEELRDRMISLVQELTSNGIKVILDTNEDIMDACKEFSPYLVRLSERNAVGYQDIKEKANDYLQAGVNYVLYSSIQDENYYMFHDSGCYKAKRYNEITSLTGSADAMIAGFIYANIRGANPIEAFRYAVTCSDVLRFSDKPCDKVAINDNANKLEVEKV